MRSCRALVERQEFYSHRLRRLAMQLEQERSAEGAAARVAALLSCLESMSHESQSLLRKARDEKEQVERRLACMAKSPTRSPG